MWFRQTVTGSINSDTATPSTPTLGVYANARSTQSSIRETLIVPESNPSNFVVTRGPLSALQESTTLSQTTVRSASAPPPAPLEPRLQPFGQQAFITPGTFTWVAPPGVFRVSVVTVGGGGGGTNGWANHAGSGAGLGWRNSIPVVPNTSYTVQVGAGGGNASAGSNSFFASLGTVAGYGGGSSWSGADTNGPNKRVFGGGFFGDGGGAGGNSQTWTGGGGAGGYSGQGGDAQSAAPATSGGAAGGGAYSSTFGTGAGGGVGILGQGPSGTTFFLPWTGSSSNQAFGGGGDGGSGGSRGMWGENPWSGQGESSDNIRGGDYGGGGGGPGTSWPSASGDGGNGAVRIIWGRQPGTERSFPSTNTGNL